MIAPSKGCRVVRARITGHVQGVFFRAWAERQAANLGLSGWVRNCRDGSVEAMFAGTRDAVGEMLRRCSDGPPKAIVEKVRVEEEGGEPPKGFLILRDA